MAKDSKITARSKTAPAPASDEPVVEVEAAKDTSKAISSTQTSTVVAEGEKKHWGQGGRYRMQSINGVMTRVKVEQPTEQSPETEE